MPCHTADTAAWTFCRSIAAGQHHDLDKDVERTDDHVYHDIKVVGRRLGMVIYRNFAQSPAPSNSAAS